MNETLTGELVEPDDVAAVLAFLCEPGARRMTGQTAADERSSMPTLPCSRLAIR